MEWTFILLVAAFTPVISILLEKRRNRVFRDIAEKYNFTVHIAKPPFFLFISPMKVLCLRHITGQLNGHSVELKDEILFGYWFNLWAFHNIFYLFRGVQYVTKISVDGTENEVAPRRFGLFYSLASPNAILGVLSDMATCKESSS